MTQCDPMGSCLAASPCVVGVVLGLILLEGPASAQGPDRWKLVELAPPRLPTVDPDWAAKAGGVMGPAQETWLQAQVATVIVKSGAGWGSGVCVAPEGWILTNYHVVEADVQREALGGAAAQPQIIACAVQNGQVHRRDGYFGSKVMRCDPVKDLALLKLDVPLSPGSFPVPVRLGDRAARPDDACTVIGSMSMGPAWLVRHGLILRTFRFPDELSDAIGAASSPAISLSRQRLSALATDCQIGPGDSGGPVLDDRGTLIGLTFGLPADGQGPRIGYHVALDELKDFVSPLPEATESVPPDLWVAARPDLHKTICRPLGAGSEGTCGAITLRFDDRIGIPRAVAVFEASDSKGVHMDATPMALLPDGLWGVEHLSSLKTRMCVIATDERLRIVGYATEGEYTEIRVDRLGNGRADIVWMRSAVGGKPRWKINNGAASLPLRAERVTDSEWRHVDELLQSEANAAHLSVAPLLR